MFDDVKKSRIQPLILTALFKVIIKEELRQSKGEFSPEKNCSKLDNPDKFD